MTEGKSINLLKAAKELNIGIATAVDFLSKKGYDIESKPNTKLNGEMYNVLLKEYQGDKIVKEEANQIVIGKIRRDETPIESTQDRSDRGSETEEVLIKNSTFSPPSVEIKSKVEEILPSSNTEEDKVEDTNTNSRKGVKVVGKIDLKSLNHRTKPEKAKPSIEEVKKGDEIELKPTPAAPLEAEVIKEEIKPSIPEAPVDLEKPVESPKPVVEAEEKKETPESKPEEIIAEKPREEKISAENT